MNENNRLQEKNEQNLINLDLRSLWEVLKSNKMLIAIVVLIGLFVNIAAGFLIKPEYTKRIVISLPVSEHFAFQTAEIRPIIQDINSMIELDRKDILIKDQVFSAEDLEGILGVLITDISQETGIYLVVIKSRREENIPNVARGVIQYLKSHEYFSTRVEKQRILLNKQIELFQMAVDNAESLKATFLDLIKKENPLDLSFNVADIAKTIRDMKIELENTQKEMALFKEMEIISRLDSPPDRETYNFVRNSIVGVTLSLFLGVVIALVLGWKRLVL